MKNRCQNCRHWRFKGNSEADPIGVGVCENPLFTEQVNIISEEMMSEHFAVAPSTARFIVASMRVHGDFGCVHFEPI